MEKAPETGIEESSSPNTSQDDHKQWIEAQDDLKRRLVTEDDFSWKLSKENEEEEEEVLLRYAGGVDISFSKEDTSVACGTLVVLDIQSQDLQTVYHDRYLVTLTVPYVPGFLAFREVYFLSSLLSFVNAPFGIAYFR